MLLALADELDVASGLAAYAWPEALGVALVLALVVGVALDEAEGLAEPLALADGVADGVVAGPVYGASSSTARNASLAVELTRATVSCAALPGTVTVIRSAPVC